ncbi:MAG: hypothetical protein K0R29_159 [Pseudobdellovibrio sp.]|jgi:hypothetical protein|nr:hypothetical protein [Pseudobdellovibrio sp.]
MGNPSKTPWELGAVLVCSKCGAKFNQPNSAEETKSEVRKWQKANETQEKIRVIVSGCLGVCYPERQTFSYMPVNGPTEVYTTELGKDLLVTEVKSLISDKISQK